MKDMKSEHKFWKDGIPENERNSDMRFLFMRRDEKKIKSWTQEQRESALRNLEDWKFYFDTHYEETKKILNQ